MSEPLKVISLQRPHLSADRERWCEETTVGSRGNHGWFAWFVWGGRVLPSHDASRRRRIRSR